MSRAADAGVPGDDGFSLVEIVVALGILVLLVVMMLPQLVVSIKGNDVARQSVQEKGFAQSELESMRNLPFHVAPAAGDYIDVLDRYYPRLTTPSTTPRCGTGNRFKAPTLAWTGYVGANATRCAWEPVGAFYRTVKTEVTDAALRGFVLVLDTQFLTDATPPVVVTPQTGYDTGVVRKDTPPTAQIGVTVSVFRTDRDSGRPMTTYGQITRRDQLDPLVESSVDVTAVQLGTSTTDRLPVTLAGGLVGLDASLTSTSRSSAVLAATTTGISTGQQSGGASGNLSAPPTAALPATDVAGGSLDATGCELVCWGSTRRSALSVSSDGGLPGVASPSAPAQVTLRDASSGALALDAGHDAQMQSSLALRRPLVAFDSTASGVRADVTSGCATSEAGDVVRLAASGWLRTTSPVDTTAPSVVEACGVARATRISVLPTTFATHGIIRLTLTGAAVRCLVSGAAHTASTSVTYAATIERWTGPADGDYAVVGTVTQATASDLLAAVPLSTPLGTKGTLGDYIESWSAGTASDVEQSHSTGEASVSVPGIVNVLTQPVRRLDGGDPDPVSSVSLSLGVLGCSAEDHR